MKQIIFRGAATALVTPMHSDGSLDLKTLARLTEWQIQSGIAALIPCGTTGEAATLSEAERLSVIQTVVEAAAGRVPIIAGAGCNDTARAVQNCKAAKAAGADALLLVTPYYNKCTPKGLQAHFKKLAAATNLPIILYNVPSRTGVAIDWESRQELSRMDSIVGFKEAGTDFSLINRHLLELNDTLPLYSGNDDLTLPLMSMGAHGCISVLSNILPHSTEALCDFLLQNDLPAARALHYQLLPLIKALFSEVNPIPVKAARPLIHFSCGQCRMPLSPIEPEHLTLLQEYFSIAKDAGLC